MLCWELETQRVVWRLTGHSRRISSLALSADRRTLVSASDDGTVAIWDMETRRQKLCVEVPTHTDARHCTAISPDGCTLAVAARDGRVVLWDLD